VEATQSGPLEQKESEYKEGGQFVALTLRRPGEWTKGVWEFLGRGGDIQEQGGRLSINNLLCAGDEKGRTHLESSETNKPLRRREVHKRLKGTRAYPK